VLCYVTKTEANGTAMPEDEFEHGGLVAYQYERYVYHRYTLDCYVLHILEGERVVKASDKRFCLRS